MVDAPSYAMVELAILEEKFHKLPPKIKEHIRYVSGGIAKSRYPYLIFKMPEYNREQLLRMAKEAEL